MSVDFILEMFDKGAGRRVAYFPFFGRREEDGITYGGPGFAARLMSLDGDSATKWVSFDLARDYDGYAVWFVPQLSDGSRLPEKNSVERAVASSKGNRHRILTTQFGNKRVVGWHVFAAPCYEFRLTGIPVRPKSKVELTRQLP
jgi:hypothetical protein